MGSCREDMRSLASGRFMDRALLPFNLTGWVISQEKPPQLHRLWLRQSFETTNVQCSRCSSNVECGNGPRLVPESSRFEKNVP
jgi:hypothetical protein